MTRVDQSIIHSLLIQSIYVSVCNVAAAMPCAHTAMHLFSRLFLQHGRSLAGPEHAQTLTPFLAVVLKLLWHFHLNFAVCRLRLSAAPPEAPTMLFLRIYRKRKVIKYKILRRMERPLPLSFHISRDSLLSSVWGGHGRCSGGSGASVGFQLVSLRFK